MSSTSRRSFLRTAAALATASAIPVPAVAAIEPAAWRTFVHKAPNPRGERRLHIKCKRTGEVFNDVYRNRTAFYGDALAYIDYLLRDWHRDAVVRMDRRLIELLANVQQQIGYDNPLTVISAYRTRKTNQQITRAAKNSFHMKGMAVDLRVHGVSTHELRNIAKQQNAGGIGYYPNRGFVHLDTGPARSWRG